MCILLKTWEMSQKCVISFYIHIKRTIAFAIALYIKNYYFLNIPNGLPTGKNTFPKWVFNTAAPHP